MEPQIRVLDRRYTILLFVIEFVLLVCILFIIYYRPTGPVTSPEIDKALIEQRKTLLEQREVFDKMLEQDRNSISYLNTRDSLQNVRLEKIYKEKLKNQSNEKINSINGYGSRDIIRAFAELEK